MIKAIIFDCFGVLATEGLLPFWRDYFSDKPALLQEARELNRRVDVGFESYGTMIKWLAEAANISETAVRNRIDHNVPDEALFAYIISTLKPHHKIGFLSNVGQNWLPEIFQPEQIALFDAIALSFETGYIKPEPEAYDAIATKLGFQPGECIMIDDQERYCDGARAVGMQAIVYTSAQQLQAELPKLLV